MAEYRIKINTKDIERADQLIKKTGGDLKQISEDEVLVKLKYEEGKDEINKIIQKLYKESPTLGVKIDYIINEEALEKQQEKLHEMSLSVNSDDLLKEINNISKVYNEKFNSDAPQEELDKLEGRLGALFATLFSKQGGDDLFYKLSKEAQQLSEDLEGLSNYDNANPLPSISENKYKKQLQIVDSLIKKRHELLANDIKINDEELYDSSFGLFKKAGNIDQLREQFKLLKSINKDIKIYSETGAKGYLNASLDELLEDKDKLLELNPILKEVGDTVENIPTAKFKEMFGDVYPEKAVENIDAQIEATKKLEEENENLQQRLQAQADEINHLEEQYGSLKLELDGSESVSNHLSEELTKTEQKLKTEQEITSELKKQNEELKAQNQELENNNKLNDNKDNLNLEEKLEYLKKIKSENKFLETAYDKKSNMEDKAWDAGGNNPKSEAESQKRIQQYEDLCEHINLAEHELDEFDNKYEKILITKKNGEQIELFSSDDLYDLSLAKKGIADIKFVLDEDIEALHKDEQAINENIAAHKELAMTKQESFVHNAYNKYREIDDWIVNNVNAQMSPPHVNFIDTSEEIQEAIDKITNYKNELITIYKDVDFKKISEGRQSDIILTIDYLDKLINTEKYLLELNHKMHEEDESSKSNNALEEELTNFKTASDEIKKIEQDLGDFSERTAEELFEAWDKLGLILTDVYSPSFQEKGQVYNKIKSALEELGYEFDGFEQKWKKIQTETSTAKVVDFDKFKNETKETTSEVVSDLNKQEQGFEQLGAGAIRVLSEIGLSYDEYVAKINSQKRGMDWGERLATIKDGKIQDSIRGTQMQVGWGDEVKLDNSIEKILHLHPNGKGQSEVFSSEDILGFFDKVLSKGYNIPFELWQNGQRTSLDFGTMSRDIIPHVVTALSQVDEIVRQNLKKNGGNIKSEYTDEYQQLTNSLFKAIMERYGGKFETNKDIDSKIDSQLIKNNLKVLEEYTHYLRGDKDGEFHGEDDTSSFIFLKDLFNKIKNGEDFIDNEVSPELQKLIEKYEKVKKEIEDLLKIGNPDSINEASQKLIDLSEANYDIRPLNGELFEENEKYFNSLQDKFKEAKKSYQYKIGKEQNKLLSEITDDTFVNAVREKENILESSLDNLEHLKTKSTELYNEMMGLMQKWDYEYGGKPNAVDFEKSEGLNLLSNEELTRFKELASIIKYLDSEIRKLELSKIQVSKNNDESNILDVFHRYGRIIQSSAKYPDSKGSPTLEGISKYWRDYIAECERVYPEIIKYKEELLGVTTDEERNNVISRMFSEMREEAEKVDASIEEVRQAEEKLVDTHKELSQLPAVIPLIDNQKEIKKAFNKDIQTNIFTDGDSKHNGEMVVYEAKAMDVLEESAEGAANSKSEFAKANAEVLQSILSSLTAINSESDGFKHLNNIIDKLSNEKGTEPLIKNLIQIRDILSSPVKGDSFIEAIKTIAQQGDNLKDLAAVLKNAKNQINKSNGQSDRIKLGTDLYNDLYKAQRDRSKIKEGTNTERYKQLGDSIEEIKAKIEQLKLTEEEEAQISKNTSKLRMEASNAYVEAKRKQNEANEKAILQAEKEQAQATKQAATLMKNGKLMAEYGDKVKDILAKIKAINTSVNPTEAIAELKKLRNELTSISSAAEEAGKSGKTMGQILGARFKSLIAYLGTFVQFYDIVRYTRQAISTISELDTQLVDLRKTTSMTSSELNEFYRNSTELGKQLGVTTSEVIAQAAAWSRLGYSSQEAATQMAQMSSKFASISPGMTTDQSTDYLVSTMQAYGIAVDDVERKILDNVNKIGNTFATTNAEIGEMLTRSSAAMKAANNSLEETIALESAAVEITRNAETTGTAFRTVSMRIRGKQLMPPYSESYMLCA